MKNSALQTKDDDFTMANREMSRLAKQCRKPQPTPTKPIAELILSLHKTLETIAQEPHNTDLAFTSDIIWDEILFGSTLLATTPSTTLIDICGKIDVWRLLAPETSEEEERQADQALAITIFRDIETLARKMNAQDDRRNASSSENSQGLIAD